MHPDPAFRDDDAALDRVAAIGFAHIAVVTPAGLMMIHVPVTRHGGDLRFHVARRNRACPHLDGATALLSVSPLNGYISPNWYADPGDQVPTWNYVSIEVEGTVRRLDEEDLVDQLDRLAALHEPRVNPAAPWTRAKMNDARFRAMLRGIAGYRAAPDRDPWHAQTEPEQIGGGSNWGYRRPAGQRKRDTGRGDGRDRHGRTVSRRIAAAPHLIGGGGGQVVTPPSTRHRHCCASRWNRGTPRVPHGPAVRHRRGRHPAGRCSDRR